MNIGIVCYPTVGGSGIVATELAFGLAELGHKVHIISYSPPFRFNKFNENIFFHSVNHSIDYPLFTFPLLTLSLTSKIAEVVEIENLDIVHCHYAIPHSLSSILAKEIVYPSIDVKVITTLHGTDISIVGFQPNYRKIVQYSLNKSDYITSVSHFLYNITKSEFSPTKPFEVIHNFVDVNEYQRKDNIDLRRNYANDSEKIVIHISNFRPIKRVTDVVLAFAKINKEIPSKLLLVGDGPDTPKIEELVKNLNLTKNVIFLGVQKAIQELLSISDLFLMTSQTESFSLAALEALSCEVPVVCYDVGGLKELITNDITGYLCEFGDIEALFHFSIKLLKDDKLRTKIGKNGRKIVETKFEKNIIIPKYLEIYTKALN